MTSEELIKKYLESRHQYAKAQFGSAEVFILEPKGAFGKSTSSSGKDLPQVRVTWPGVGRMTPIEALEASAHFIEAARVALECENIIREWGGMDRWREP